MTNASLNKPNRIQYVVRLESKESRRQPQCEVSSRIRVSAALSLGRIEHWNSSRCLEIRTFSHKMQLWSEVITYTATRRSVDAAALTGISLPFWSFAFTTSNTDRTDEVARKIMASAR